jgi:hypothetical protein
MAAVSRLRACCSVVSVLLLVSGTDGVRDETALLQTATSVQHSPFSSNFFDDPIASQGSGMPHRVQAVATPSRANFDVGRNAVPMSLRLKRGLQSLHSMVPRPANTAEPGSFAETSVQTANTPKQQAWTISRSNKQKTMLEEAFQLADEVEQLKASAKAAAAEEYKASAQAASMQVSDSGTMGAASLPQLPEIVTEPPLAAASSAKAFSEASSPQVIFSDTSFQHAAQKPDQVDYEDSERFETPAKFVECQEFGGQGCTTVNTKTAALDASLAAVDADMKRQQQAVEDDFERRQRNQEQLSLDFQSVKTKTAAPDASLASNKRPQQAFEDYFERKAVDDDFERRQWNQEQLSLAFQSLQKRHIEDSTRWQKHPHGLRSAAAQQDSPAVWPGTVTNPISQGSMNQRRQPATFDLLEKSFPNRALTHAQSVRSNEMPAGETEAATFDLLEKPFPNRAPMHAQSVRWNEMPLGEAEALTLHQVEEPGRRQQPLLASARTQLLGYSNVAEPLVNARMQMPAFAPPRSEATHDGISLEEVTQQIEQDEKRILAAVQQDSLAYPSLASAGLSTEQVYTPQLSQLPQQAPRDPIANTDDIFGADVLHSE